MDINSLIRSALQHYQSGDLEKAQYFCEKILKKLPDNTNILYLLGIIYAQLKNYDPAIHYIKKSLQFDPGNADAHFALGIALQQKGILDEAAIAFQKTIELKPNTIEAYYYLAEIYQGKNQFDEAISYYKEVQKFDPHNTRLYYNLGQVFHKKGQYEEAIFYYQKAIELNPVLIDVHNALGNSFQEKRAFDKAISSYQQAAQIDPNSPTAYINLGITHGNMGKFDDAISFFQRALSLNPNLAEVYHHIGLILIKIGKYEEALESYRILLQINPDSAVALTNFGFILSKQGKIDKAIACFQHALKIHPSDLTAYEALLMNMLYHSHYDAKAIFLEHRRFADKCIASLSPVILRHTNERKPNRKLKIGYVSSDFKRSSVAYFFEPVLASHHRQQFEVFCYSSVEIPDETTERIKSSADHFTDIVRLSDERAAELVRQDAIDILIDLAGYTFNNRILLFTHKPSPIQISWIGYPATTGLSAIDYKIVDNYTDPPGMTEQFYTEKLIRLPDCFLCYLPFADSPEIGGLPVLKKGNITFGSFNNFSKISPETFFMWTDILNKTANSRLIIKADGLSDKTTRNYALDMFAKGGVETERIELHPWLTSTEEHLNLYNQVDIALDTYPYNGTTTTCESIWMGVPVITLAGNTHVSRVGVSLLSNISLPELIAKTPDEYVAIAINLANDLKKLQSLRESLRERMSRSPLTDSGRFIMHLEDCYRSIWEQWCNSDP